MSGVLKLHQISVSQLTAYMSVVTFTIYSQCQHLVPNQGEHKVYQVQARSTVL